MSRRYIIIRHCSGMEHSSEKLHHHPEHHPVVDKVKEIKSKIPLKGIPYEIFANELMEYEPFIKYLQENGSHFTPELAEHVSHKAKSGIFMTSEMIKASLNSSSMKLPKDITLGDFTYLVNNKYFGHPDAIAKAMDSVKVQPYPGFIFNRWLADHIGLGQSIPWDDFVNL